MLVPDRHNTCAVLVTYFPDQGFSERLALVLEQFAFAIIVDNGSDDTARQFLHKEALSPSVLLIANPKNLGIAVALNQGAKLATERGFSWIMTLDQDTVVYADMFETIVSVYKECLGSKSLIGVNYWNASKNDNFLNCQRTNSIFQRKKTLITSGTLTPLKLLQEVGPFRDDYFIDSVDHELCLRARKHGWKIIITCKPCMSHSIGIDMKNAGWLRKRLSFNHSPTRKYFIARNTVNTIKLYLLQEPIWCLRQVCRLCADIFSIAAFEDQKVEKVRAFLVGIVHGIRGNLGPIEKAWPRGSR